MKFLGKYPYILITVRTFCDFFVFGVYIYVRFPFPRYTHDKRFDRALGIYLKLKHKDVFDLIHRHNLFDSISDKIVLLMEFDAEAAVKMLLDNKDKVPVRICAREVFYLFLHCGKQS